MPIVLIDHITRQMLRDEPAARFVFGDNAQRRGMGGQAKECRHEPNAIGVATKWKPSMDVSAFFSDDDPEALKIVEADLYKVTLALDEERTVYVPRAGIGTGLAEMPKRAPRLYAKIAAHLSASQNV